MLTSYTISSSVTVLLLLVPCLLFLTSLCLRLLLQRRVPTPPAFSFFGTFLKQLRKAPIIFDISICPSVRPSARNNSVPLYRVFVKLCT